MYCRSVVSYHKKGTFHLNSNIIIFMKNKYLLSQIKWKIITLINNNSNNPVVNLRNMEIPI